MTKPPVAIVAAVARNGVIGSDNRLLWRLSSDLKRFKALTMGTPVVMGRKTFQSLPPAGLPGRMIVVVTRGSNFAAPGVVVAPGIGAALDLAAREAARSGAEEIMIAGGADIYAQTIGLAERLYLTEVDLAPDGDASFPALDPSHWREVARLVPPRGERDEAAFAFVDYVRRPDARRP